MHRGCFVWTPTPPLAGRRTPRPGPVRVCVCSSVLAGSGRPASRARSGAPHLFLWLLCLFALLGPLWAGFAPVLVLCLPQSPLLLFFSRFSVVFFLAPTSSLALSGFRPRVPWALALFVVCFVGLALLGSPCALAFFVLPGRWPLSSGCPPPPLSRCCCRSLLPCACFSFLLSAPPCFWLSVFSGPGCPGPWRWLVFVVLGSPCSVFVSVFSAPGFVLPFPSFCVPWLAAGCCPPPPLLCLAAFVVFAWCLFFFSFFFLSSCAPLLSPAFSGFRPRMQWALALCFVCFSLPPAARLSVRARLVCVSGLAEGCSLVVAAPLPFCVSSFSSLLLGALVFFSSSVRPRCLQVSLVSGPACPGPLRCALFALLAFRFPALCALSPLSCFPPGRWLLPGGCCPPPPLCLAVFVAAARCCVPCAVLCCVSLGAVLRRAAARCAAWCCALVCCVALLRPFGACCAMPSGAAHRPWALCFAALCFAVFPCAVCSVLCVFCRGVLVRAVVCRSALCCVCPGMLCCAFPVLCALCGAVLRCAGALALCCLCGPCCCWRLVLWCAAVCCAVSSGVLWCSAGSGGPWLSAGRVFRCRCPCLTAWSASLWLMWCAVVPCFPVSCAVMLCCRMVLCCCVLPSCCGAVGACFALLWPVVLCCVVLLVGCAVFCPVVVSACCGALSLVLCVPCLLHSVRCGALLCWLWCPASLCRVLWRCAVMWCCAAVLCCHFAVLFVFALPSCGLSSGAVLCCVVLLVVCSAFCPVVAFVCCGALSLPAGTHKKHQLSYMSPRVGGGVVAGLPWWLRCPGLGAAYVPPAAKARQKRQGWGTGGRGRYILGHGWQPHHGWLDPPW